MLRWNEWGRDAAQSAVEKWCGVPPWNLTRWNAEKRQEACRVARSRDAGFCGRVSEVLGARDGAYMALLGQGLTEDVAKETADQILHQILGEMRVGYDQRLDELGKP